MTKEQALVAAEVMRRWGNGEIVLHSEVGARLANGSPVWTSNDPRCLMAFNWINYNYKILEILPPPAGEEWHNPHNLNATEVGVHEGWRLLLKSEVGNRTNLKSMGVQYKFPKCAKFNFACSSEQWSYTNTLSEECYRTKNPLPVNHLNKARGEWLETNTLPQSLDNIFDGGWEACKKHYKIKE